MQRKNRGEGTSLPMGELVKDRRLWPGWPSPGRPGSWCLC